MKIIKTPTDRNGSVWYLNNNHIIGFKEYENDSKPWLDVFLNVTPPSTTPHKLTFVGVTAEAFLLLCL
jgi:hypothetical protein